MRRVVGDILFLELGPLDDESDAVMILSLPFVCGVEDLSPKFFSVAVCHCRHVNSNDSVEFY